MSVQSIKNTDPEEHVFDSFAAIMRESFAGSGPLFTTDAGDLWAVWLENLPEGERQHHNCNACRRFVENYGSLVTIDEGGIQQSAVWLTENVPTIYAESVKALAKAVRKAPVNGVFLSSVATLGLPQNVATNILRGYWSHMAVTLPKERVFRASSLKTAGQAIAEKLEEHGMLGRALGEFSADHVQAAVTLLEAGNALYRSEKCLGVARWLLDLMRTIGATKDQRIKANLLWRAVATAPVGWAHVRTTMIGTLLEDLQAGLDIATVQRRFAAKMDPLIYQRPQVAPSAGNIAEAEKVIAAMDAAGSLRRRFARLEDLVTLWTPKPVQPAEKGGVFGHLKAKGEAPKIGLVLPTSTMTWDKFSRDVLPVAERIEFQAPSHGSYFAFVTACDPEAPPILQWDHEDARNPVSWYVYGNGSPATQWGLFGWVDVTAITDRPSQWDATRKQEHHGRAAHLILNGAKDSGRPGLGLFPEILRSELHAIRATLEAHSAGQTPEGREEASACGWVGVRNSSGWGFTLRVHRADGSVGIYKIDRWD